MKRYCIRTVARTIGSLPVESFPYHVEDPKVAWVRFDDVDRLRAEAEAMRSVVEAARNFAMDDVRSVPDLFNALRAALWTYDAATGKETP